MNVTGAGRPSCLRRVPGRVQKGLLGKPSLPLGLSIKQTQQLGSSQGRNPNFLAAAPLRRNASKGSQGTVGAPPLFHFCTYIQVQTHLHTQTYSHVKTRRTNNACTRKCTIHGIALPFPLMMPFSLQSNPCVLVTTKRARRFRVCDAMKSPSATIAVVLRYGRKGPERQATLQRRALGFLKGCWVSPKCYSTDSLFLPQ